MAPDYTSAAVGSNGHFTFGTISNAFALSCMPVSLATDAMGPYWRDQRTDTVGGCTGCGIFTTTTGTAPNRVFQRGVSHDLFRADLGYPDTQLRGEPERERDPGLRLHVRLGDSLHGHR